MFLSYLWFPRLFIVENHTRGNSCFKSSLLSSSGGDGLSPLQSRSTSLTARYASLHLPVITCDIHSCTNIMSLWTRRMQKGMWTHNRCKPQISKWQQIKCDWLLLHISINPIDRNTVFSPKVMCSLQVNKFFPFSLDCNYRWHLRDSGGVGA